MPNGTCSHLRTAVDFIWIGADYWLRIYPRVRRELREWRERAAAIPDPTLRGQALASLRDKSRHAEGAAAFAVLSPRASRPSVIRFLVAFQVMYDYLDTVSEKAGSGSFDNTMQLHTALADALMPGVPEAAAYDLNPQSDDGGYLTAFIHTCRTCCTSLPAFPIIAPMARSAAELARESQGYNHALPAASPSFLADVVVPWASTVGGDANELTWWESIGATGSSLAILVLVAAAGDPSLGRSERDAIHAVYMPWGGAVLAMIDSLVDRESDKADDTHSLIARYATSALAAERLSVFVARAIALTQRTAHPERHALIIASMIALFASSPEAKAPQARDAIQRALDVAGPRGTLPLAVFRTRRRLQTDCAMRRDN